MGRKFVFLLLVFVCPAFAVTGIVAGLVLDPGGSPIVGATVSVEGTSYGTMTSARGEYVIPSLQPGEYTLVARMVGRATERVEGVIIQSDHTSRIDFELAEDVSGSTVIRVVESRSHILRDIPATAYQLDFSQTQTMTAGGLVEVVAAQPGVVRQNGELHVRGGRAGEVDYVLNGISLKSPMDNRFNFDVPMSAVSEATFMTGGLSIEYGNSLSGVVDLISKRGSDSFTGSITGRMGSVSTGMLSSGEEIFMESIDVDQCRTGLSGCEMSFSGPEPVLSSILPGETTFSFAGQFSTSGDDNRDTRGNWSYNWLNDGSGMASITSRPDPGTSVSLSAIGSYREHGWNQWAWSRYNEISFMEGVLFPPESQDLALPAMFSQTTGIILNFDKLLGDRTSFNFTGGTILHENWNRIYDEEGGFIGEDMSPIFWLTQYTPPALVSDSAGFYHNGVHQNVWHDSKASVSTGRLSLDWNPNPRVRFKAGLEGSYYDLYHYNVYYVSPGNAYLSLWNAWPFKGAAYVQGSYRFTGGVIGTAGVRADLFDANTTYFSTEEQETVDAESHVNYSPRLSLSIPFSERSLFFLTYGQYFQMPPMNSLFLETTYNTGASTIVAGNPLLEPELTSLFELGIRQEMDMLTDLALSFYNKDITGLISAADDSEGQYFVYSNDDSHGNVQGLELSVTRAPGERLSGQMYYTLSFAKGRYSSVLERYNYAQYGVFFTSNEDNYLDWDQTHQAGATVSLNTYQSEGPEIGGFHPLENAGLSVSWRFGSGTPYSLPPETSELVEINNFRQPSTMQTDLSVSRGMNIWGTDLKLTGAVYNLFNRRNVDHIYDTAIFHATEDPTGQAGNPRAWSPARHFLFSAELSW